MDHVDGTRSGSTADESGTAQQQAGLGSDILSCPITSGLPRKHEERGHAHAWPAGSGLLCSGHLGTQFAVLCSPQLFQ